MKRIIRNKVEKHFVQNWHTKVKNVELNTSLRTYTLIKNNFGTENYLSLIKKSKYLIAFTRFRAGSHTLEIERGRYTNPKTPIEERLCLNCLQIEDEVHFLTACTSYLNDRATLFERINEKHAHFENLNNIDKFIFLMTNKDAQILSWTAKFIHDCMYQRSVKFLSSVEKNE